MRGGVSAALAAATLIALAIPTSLRALRKAGIQNRRIYLAWDFTVASQQSLAGRLLHIRDEAFRSLGDRNLRDQKVAGRTPSFTIDAVTDLTPAEDDRIARRTRRTRGAHPGPASSCSRRSAAFRTRARPS